MSKSLVYEDFTNKTVSSRLLFDFLLENGLCGENAEMAIKVTISFTISDERIELPLSSDLSYPQIQHILDATGSSFEDFITFAIAQTKGNL